MADTLLNGLKNIDKKKQGNPENVQRPTVMRAPLPVMTVSSA
jgi:hypothetical protein